MLFELGRIIAEGHGIYAGIGVGLAGKTVLILARKDFLFTLKLLGKNKTAFFCIEIGSPINQNIFSDIFSSVRLSKPSKGNSSMSSPSLPNSSPT